MPRLFRCGLLALAFTLLLATVSPASAQTTVPAADAAKFMGSWALTFAEGPQGPFNVTATVTADNGQAAAEVSSDFDPTPIKVKTIAKAGDSLVLNYTAGPDGTFAIKLTLAPDVEDKVKGTLEVGDFSMTGAGVKKK